MKRFEPPSKEKLEEDLKQLEIAIGHYNELNKSKEFNKEYGNIISYTEGQINLLRYVLGYYEELI